MSRVFGFYLFVITIFIVISLIACKDYTCSKLTKPEEFAIVVNDTKEYRYTKCELRNVKYLDKVDNFNLIVENTDEYFEMDSLRKDIFAVSFKSSTLHKIPNELFMQASFLKVLDMSTCGLRELDLLSFNKAENLNELHMQDNELIELVESYFLHTKQLKILDISSNRIKIIGEHAFKGLGSLERLSLSNNRLRTLDDVIFIPLRSLEWIWLDHNKLTLISSYLFSSSQYNLKGAYLNSNQITAISPFAFEDSPYFDFLMVSDNNCTNRNFIGHKISGIAVKYEMKSCIKEFLRLFPDENPRSYRLQQDVRRMQVQNEACHYVKNNLQDALKKLET